MKQWSHLGCSLDKSDTGSRPRSRLASRQSRQLSPSPASQSKTDSSVFEKKTPSEELGFGILPVETKVVEVEEEERVPDWIRCSPADLYFKRDRVVSFFFKDKLHGKNLFITLLISVYLFFTYAELYCGFILMVVQKTQLLKNVWYLTVIAQLLWCTRHESLVISNTWF